MKKSFTCVQPWVQGPTYTNLPEQLRMVARSLKFQMYCKAPKFSGTRKLCCNMPKIQTKRQILRVFCQKDANGIANSEDPDQTAPPGAV